MAADAYRNLVLLIVIAFFAGMMVPWLVMSHSSGNDDIAALELLQMAAQVAVSLKMHVMICSASSRANVVVCAPVLGLFRAGEAA